MSRALAWVFFALAAVTFVFMVVALFQGRWDSVRDFSVSTALLGNFSWLVTIQYRLDHADVPS